MKKSRKVNPKVVVKKQADYVSEEAEEAEEAEGVTADGEIDDKHFKSLIMQYATASKELTLIRWVLLLMCLEDLPSFGFNTFFLASAWPNLEGFTVPVVSLIITTLSIGYKLSYLQKMAVLRRKKAIYETRL